MVPCTTPWGRWYQTLEEVFIEVRVPPGTRAKDVRCSLRSRHIALAVGGQELLQVPRAARAAGPARPTRRPRGAGGTRAQLGYKIPAITEYSLRASRAFLKHLPGL